MINLDINEYYEASKLFRKNILLGDEDVLEKSFERLKKTGKWDHADIHTLKNSGCSLNDAKQVVAVEQGYSNWGDLRRDIETKIAEAKEASEGHFVLGLWTHEAGDVVENDIVSLGNHKEKSWAVDMILEKMYEVKPHVDEIGVDIKVSDRTLLEGEELLEPPEDDDWNKWAQAVQLQYSE